MTIEEAKKKYPDAVELRTGSQVVITEDQARILTYKKDVKAKCLFNRSIPTAREVKYLFIFSVKAYQEEEAA